MGSISGELEHGSQGSESLSGAKKIVCGNSLMSYVFVTDIFIETTMQDVCLQLVKEEATQATLGNLPRHNTSVLTFLMISFELEDSQYVCHYKFI